jgi:hypothetical protein
MRVRALTRVTAHALVLRAAVGVATKAPAVPQSHAPAAQNRFVIHLPAACMRYRTLRPVSKRLGVPRRNNGWSFYANAHSHYQDLRQGRQGTMPTLRYRSDPTHWRKSPVIQVLKVLKVVHKVEKEVYETVKMYQVRR